MIAASLARRRVQQEAQDEPLVIDAEAPPDPI